MNKLSLKSVSESKGETLDPRIIAELQSAVKHRNRPSLDDIDAANILLALRVQAVDSTEIHTEAEIAGARALLDEYDAAIKRGEEPHFPHEAQWIIDALEKREWAATTKEPS